MTLTSRGRMLGSRRPRRDVRHDDAEACGRRRCRPRSAGTNVSDSMRDRDRVTDPRPVTMVADSSPLRGPRCRRTARAPSTVDAYVRRAPGRPRTCRQVEARTAAPTPRGTMRSMVASTRRPACPSPGNSRQPEPVDPLDPRSQRGGSERAPPLSGRRRCQVVRDREVHVVEAATGAARERRRERRVDERGRTARWPRGRRGCPWSISTCGNAVRSKPEPLRRVDRVERARRRAARRRGYVPSAAATPPASCSPPPSVAPVRVVHRGPHRGTRPAVDDLAARSRALDVLLPTRRRACRGSSSTNAA